MIHMDFETYSEADLRNTGVYKYAEHPSTEVLVLSYSTDGTVRHWLPGKLFPQELIDKVAEGDTVCAHNAQFEYNIWNTVLRRMLGALPRLLSKQLNCTAGRAAMCGLPRSLAKVGEALNLKIQKDKRGDTLVRFFCMPRKPTKSNTDTRNLPKHYPEMFKELIEYCNTDVASEMELDGRLPQFSNFDRRMYRLDTLLNDRGIPIDIESIKHASVIVQDLEQRAHKKVISATGVRPTQRNEMLKWLINQGLDLDNLQAATIKTLLERKDLSPNIRDLLALRIEASKVSTKKLISMARVACVDTRARGTLLYYGAHTGRWSGKLIQPHNFIRGLPDKQAQIVLMHQMFPLLNKGDADLIEALFDNPLTAIAQCMRGFIAAKKGKILRIVDYAQIEARILVWLAEQIDVLDQFRQGLDVYRELAAFLWIIPVSEVTMEQRRIAKNLVLGCGFGLGWEKFIEYCAKAGVLIEQEMSKRAVKAYRERNAKVVAYWNDVENCAIAATRAPGKYIYLRNVSFYCEADKSFLRILLPSGRSIRYPSPQVKIVERFGFPKAQLTFMTEMKGIWMRVGTYGGKLVENIVQATACDMMVCGGIQAEKAGYPLVLTVHDEWLSECDKGFGSVKELEKIVCILPSWANGCPVTAEGFETERYRKN